MCAQCEAEDALFARLDDDQRLQPSALSVALRYNLVCRDEDGASRQGPPRSAETAAGHQAFILRSTTDYEDVCGGPEQTGLRIYALDGLQ